MQLYEDPRVLNDGFKTHPIWQPIYGNWNLDSTRIRLESLVNQFDLNQEDVQKSENFICRIFEEWEGQNVKPYDFLFVVPHRLRRSDSAYSSELYQFLPVLKEFGPITTQLLCSSLPPFAAADIGVDEARGALYSVPVYADMIKDIGLTTGMRKAREIVNRAILNEKNNRNIKLVGLGATLPGMTRFGTKIDISVKTTTGHGATVALMVDSILERLKEKGGSVGILGLGSIGLSAATTLVNNPHVSKLYIYDTQKTQIDLFVKSVIDLKSKIVVCKSHKELIECSQIIGSAITSEIDLKKENIDVSNTYIVDDSQPGAFDIEQVEAGGGVLQWVVAKDDSLTSSFTRSNRYIYGDDGLVAHSDLWGCEAEVAAIAINNRFDLCLNRPVGPSDVDDYRKLLREVGINPALPQAFGKLV